MSSVLVEGSEARWMRPATSGVRKMEIIIVVGEGSDFWEAFMRLLERFGYRGVRSCSGLGNMKTVNRSGKIVAHPLDVRILELACTDGKR